jgi:flagellar hook-length control protein FliK
MIINELKGDIVPQNSVLKSQKLQNANDEIGYANDFANYMLQVNSGREFKKSIPTNENDLIQKKSYENQDNISKDNIDEEDDEFERLRDKKNKKPQISVVDNSILSQIIIPNPIAQAPNQQAISPNTISDELNGNNSGSVEIDASIAFANMQGKNSQVAMQVSQEQNLKVPNSDLANETLVSQENAQNLAQNQNTTSTISANTMQNAIAQNIEGLEAALKNAGFEIEKGVNFQTPINADTQAKENAAQPKISIFETSNGQNNSQNSFSQNSNGNNTGGQNNPDGQNTGGQNANLGNALSQAQIDKQQGAKIIDFAQTIENAKSQIDNQQIVQNDNLQKPITNASSNNIVNSTSNLGANNVQNIAATMMKKFQNGDKKFTMRLDPAELGKVEIELKISSDNKITAVLKTENQQALNELMKSARDLIGALNQSGFDFSEKDLTFSLNSNDFGQNQQNNQQSNQNETAKRQNNWLNSAPTQNNDESIIANTITKSNNTIGHEIWGRTRISMTI